ncbi:MAG: GAF domain-containing protein [Firmicutes bacterium]|nr:GAF domain-containing protein [Bacillota bacterium]
MNKVLFFDDEIEQPEIIIEALKKEQLEPIITSDINIATNLLSEGSTIVAVINVETICSHEDFDRQILGRYHQDQTKPLIFILPHAESEFSPLQYEFHVDDLILKPYKPQEAVLRIINQLKKLKTFEMAGDELLRLNVLFQIGNLPYQSMHMDELSKKLLSVIAETLGCESAALYLKDEDEQILLVNKFGPADEEDLRKMIQFTTKTVIDFKKPIYTSDLSREFFWNRYRWKEPSSIKNSICIPLESNGKVTGSFELYNAPHRLISRDNDLDNRFLAQLMKEAEKVINLSVQFQRVNRDLEFAIDELSILYEISDALSSTINLEEMLRLIVRNALKSFDAQVVSLMMLDKEEGLLSIRFSEGLSEDIIRGTKLKVGDGIAGRVAKSGQPLLLVDMMGIDSVDVDKNIKSALSVPLKIKDEVIGVLNVSKTSRYRFTENDLKLLFNLASLAAQAIEKASLYSDIKNSLDEIKSSYMSTVKALSKAIEAKDPYTRGHVDRVAKYGLAVALELDSELLKDDMFRYALVLHDIGKIEIPDHILTKQGHLTDEEMAVMRRHPEVGAQILSPVRFLKEAADMVRYHQERYDGKGYPMGLKGEEIPIAARIIAVADAFDAIISDRPYRKASTLEIAKSEIMKNAGSQFDPAVVSAFMSALDKKVIP